MTDQTDNHDGHKVSLGAVLDGIVGSMDAEQFKQLAERTGHTEADPKRAAAEAISNLVRHGNIAANETTPAQVLGKIQRRG